MPDVHAVFGRIIRTVLRKTLRTLSLAQDGPLHARSTFFLTMSIESSRLQARCRCGCAGWRHCGTEQLIAVVGGRKGRSDWCGECQQRMNADSKIEIGDFLCYFRTRCCALAKGTTPHPYPSPLPLNPSPHHYPFPHHYPSPLPLNPSPHHYPYPSPLRLTTTLTPNPHHYPYPSPIPLTTSPHHYHSPLPLPLTTTPSPHRFPYPHHYPSPLPLTNTPHHYCLPQSPIQSTPSHRPGLPFNWSVQMMDGAAALISAS